MSMAKNNKNYFTFLIVPFSGRTGLKIFYKLEFCWLIYGFDYNTSLQNGKKICPAYLSMIFPCILAH